MIAMVAIVVIEEEVIVEIVEEIGEVVEVEIIVTLVQKVMIILKYQIMPAL